LAFISTLWPILLVYIVGPIGELISGGGWISGPEAGIIRAVNLIFFVVSFVAAGLWAHQPMAVIMKRWQPGLTAHPHLIQSTISDLPGRLGKAFVAVGILFSTYTVAPLFLMDSVQPSPAPTGLIIVTVLIIYFAFVLVTAALGSARALMFTMRLRKNLSSQGIFTDDLGTVEREYTVMGVAQRPWLLFILTSVLPIILVALLYLISRSIHEQHYQLIILSQMASMIAGVLIAGSFFVYTMSRLLKVVIDEIQQGVRSIQQGNFTARVAVLSDDESGDMARSLNTALKGLQERDNMKDALSIAAEIQAGLLPGSTPTVDGYAIQAIQMSCLEVGGDYYDYIEHADGRVWIVVADVAGKGYPAALTVANLHAMLHTFASSGHAFDQIPAFMNDALGRIMQAGRFVTAFIAELDPASSNIRWLNAGHPPAVLASEGGTVLLKAQGPPLGLLPGLPQTTREQRLEQGDLLAVFTDGVTEMRARRNNEDMFGIGRAEQWVLANRTEENSALPEKLIKDLARFGEPARDDDLTTLFLHRTG
jgi:serine phosphatase RsbU (regulator of sigma subunit)